jgi:hypothetical protein
MSGAVSWPARPLLGVVDLSIPSRSGLADGQTYHR